jgi:hypothetical protein
MCPEAAMTDDFIPLGYITLEQAVDAVGRYLMPHEWLGTETSLLKSDIAVTEAAPIVAEEETATDTQAGRVNRALNYLIGTLAAGDLNAMVVDEDGKTHPFPAMLWTNPGVRAVFRAGELPVHLRVAIEGHKGDTGRRCVLLSGSDLHRHLRKAGPPEAIDVEGEFRAWLAKRIEQCAEGEFPSKKQLWTETQAQFGASLPYRSFNRIWSATARPSESSS